MRSSKSPLASRIADLGLIVTVTVYVAGSCCASASPKEFPATEPPLPAFATISKPDFRSIVNAIASPPPSKLREDLAYQKKEPENATEARPSQGTVLLVPQAVVTNGETKESFWIQPPLGGYSSDTGLSTPSRISRPLAPWGTVGQAPLMDGIRFSGDGGLEVTPEDLQISVGLNYIIQANNSNVTVWKKPLSTSLSPTPWGDAKWQYLYRWNLATDFLKLDATGEQPESAGDPWIVYDWISHRWFLSAMVTRGDAQWLVVCVSQIDDPLGKWMFRSIHFANETSLRHDQPKLAVVGDKVLIAWDEWGDPPGYTTLLGGNWMVIGKDALLTSDQLISVPLAYEQGNKCLPEPIPVRTTSNVSDGVILSARKPSFPHLCPLDETPPSEANTITGVIITGHPPNINVSTRKWSVALYSGPNDSPQNKSSQLLFTGDSRILSAFRQNNRVFAAINDSCHVAPACFRVLDLNLANTNPKPVEDFDVGIAQRYLFYPSLTMDARGDLVAVASQVTDKGYLGAIVLDRLNGHEKSADWGAKTINAGSVALECPDPSWPSNLTRVGDYAGADVDPTEPSSVWLTASVPPLTLPNNGPPYDVTQCPEDSIIERVTLR